MPTYYIDPVNGNDTYAGDSFASGHPWKTLNHTFAAGDTILVAKSAETSYGTGDFTHGSVSILNYSGTALAQYNIIRVPGDNTLYMIKAVAGSTITLYRPYRGTTGTGKSINLLTPATMAASTDLKPTGNGTSTSHIILKFGINTSTLDQDGYTLWNLSNNSGYQLFGGLNATYYDVTNLALYYLYNFLYNNITDCTLTNCFTFRCSSYFMAQGQMIRCTVNSLIAENGYLQFGLFNTVFNNLESADPSHPSITLPFTQNWINATFNSPKLVGYSGQPIFSLINGTILNAVFNNPVLDEGNAGVNIFWGAFNATTNIWGLIFRNPTMGSGKMWTYDTLAYYWWWGEIAFSNINGLSTDYRKYFSLGEGSKYFMALQTRDDTIYNLSAPSVKVALQQSAYPYIAKYHIPCDANVARTIAVYLRKNSHPISTATINAAGTGYAVNDLISVTQANAGESIIRVTTIGGGGSVTGISIEPDGGGYGYSVATGLATTNIRGSGSGCKINITAIGTGYGSSTRPIMRLQWLTGSAGALTLNLHDEVMPDTDDAWVELSYQVTPSVQGSIVVELIFQSANAGAIAWYDDLGTLS